jgi:hypothetical protein
MLLHFLSSFCLRCRERIYLPLRTNTRTKYGSANRCSSDYGMSPSQMRLMQDPLRGDQFPIFFLVGRSRRLESHDSHESFRARAEAVGSSEEYPFSQPSSLLYRRRIGSPPPVVHHNDMADFRLTWSIKLSPHLHHVNELEGGIFFMETLEVIRRWIWIFFRFEAEWSKIAPNLGFETRRARGNSIPAIELSKLNPK